VWENACRIPHNTTAPLNKNNNLQSGTKFAEQGCVPQDSKLPEGAGADLDIYTPNKPRSAATGPELVKKGNSHG
jgi:hypothetical protein